MYSCETHAKLYRMISTSSAKIIIKKQYGSVREHQKINYPKIVGWVWLRYAGYRTVVRNPP